MKKWLVVLLLISSPVMAGDYLSTYANIYAQVRVNLGLDSSSTAPQTNAEMASLIRQGLVEAQNVIHAIKKIRIDTTVRSQYAYALDSTVLGVTGVEWVNGDSVKVLQQIDRDAYMSKTVNTLVGKTGYDSRPSWYDYTDDSLYLYPSPWNAGDTVKIYTWEKAQNIDTLSTLTQLKTKYRQAVFHYVLWRVALAKSHPAAEIFHSEYVQYVQSLLNQKEKRGEAPVKTGN